MQLNIFNEINSGDKNLMKAIDTINAKVGKDKVLLGIQKFQRNKKWGNVSRFFITLLYYMD